MSWQAVFQERARALVVDQAKQHDIEIRSVDEIEQDRPKDAAGALALADEEVGDGIIWIPEVRSYIGLATALHEIGHVVLGHCAPRAKKHSALQELDAWWYARKLFADHDFPWVPSVRADVRRTLVLHIEQELTDEERATLPPGLRALVDLL